MRFQTPPANTADEGPERGGERPPYSPRAKRHTYRAKGARTSVMFGVGGRSRTGAESWSASRLGVRAWSMVEGDDRGRGLPIAKSQKTRPPRKPRRRACSGIVSRGARASSPTVSNGRVVCAAWIRWSTSSETGDDASNPARDGRQNSKPEKRLLLPPRPDDRRNRSNSEVTVSRVIQRGSKQAEKNG